MPSSAQLVDELRRLVGVEAADAAIAAGQKARRRYLQIDEAEGREAADRWLGRQRFPRGCFWALEGEYEVGVKRR